MTEYQIPLECLMLTKDKVVLITRSSSGIGKATANLRNLFIGGIEQFGVIEHVFANAGIGPRSNFVEEAFKDKVGNGKLLAPPDLRVLDVNLIGAICMQQQPDSRPDGTSSRQVRLNAAAPSWTPAGIVPGDPEDVARSVVILCNDIRCNGELIYSWEGRYCEINRCEGGLCRIWQRRGQLWEVEEEVDG
ncbi:hypothetical protein BDW68DRAFT_191258 [Aspergillus falconensis]